LAICKKKTLWHVQDISEDPSKFIVAEDSNNHALNPIEEVVLNLFFFILLHPIGSILKY